MMDRYVYFVVGRFLYSVPIHGSEKQRRYMILESSYDITTISYDYVDQLLYYAADSGSPQIWTVEPNEPQHVNIMHQSMTGSGPHNLVIVPHIHKGFWLSDGNHLEVMDLETKDSVINHVTLQYEFVNPKKLVHDVKYDLLFALVASSIGHTNLLSVNYNGSASDFLYNEKDIETFALYNELIILVHKNGGDHVIRSADIGLGSPLKEIEQGKITGIQTIKDIKVLDQKALQPFEKSQCSRVSNGGCEQICLPNYLSKTPTCECFIGYKKMSNGTCVAAPVEDNFILVTDYTYNQVFQISMDNPNTVVTVPLPNLGRPDGILYIHQTNKVLWTTAGTANIWASSLNGSFQNTFADISALFVRPDRIALDPSTGNVYYTGVSQVADFLFDSVIGVVNGNGSHAVVVWEGHMPRDIVLDAGEGLMFWTDHGDRMTGVYRAQMDGSNKRSLVLDDVVWPNGVTLDYRTKRVYWTDGSLDRIYSCDYDGAERKLVRQFDNSSHLMDIQLVEDFLYFTDINMRQVQRIHKDGQGPILRVGPADLGNIQSIFYFNAAYADKTPKNEPCMVNNGGCSEICFPAPGGKHTCGCNWIHNLLADGKTCENVPRCPSVFSNAVVLEDSTCIRVSGNTCAFNCTGIYKARADVTRLTCTDVMDSDGALTWDIQYPCEMIRCPLFIPDGFVNTSCYPLPGSTCTFTCKDGYHPNPLVDHIICDMSGRWNYSAGESTLCIPHHSPHVEQEMAVVQASTGSRNMAIGLGVGVGILLLVLVVILVVISLYRLGKLGTLFGKKTPRTTSFENPRYSENNVDLQPVDGAEVSNGFHYSTLNDDKVDLTQDSRSKQHQQKQQQQSTSSINGTFGNSSA
ncbi:low-density lipoprotein receptor-related protein 6-like [Dreissena polymorpha]|uniref:low-density lipoprotein receptor-related protein 6-like n=1 Tax=Dreissena polymorpha TaxID=45954 RepID=UPI0022648F58|nr:low-density lipoprotein receptor-related protein 6-like [Dreissena polymorpha]